MPIICAIHQPNFFPWLGYFDKIKRADIFVFLDDVQNPKKGSSWFNRTKLNCVGKEKWVTVPISRPHGFTLINKVEFSDSEWKAHFLEVLNNYYRKCAAHGKVVDEISNLIAKKDYQYLADLNRDAILYFSNKFGYQTKFISKSELNIESKSTQMLIDVCKAVGADTYLCGGGASGYQEDALFKKEEINLIYQDYAPVLYGNPDTYLPGLSIIDYLMRSDHVF